MALLKSKKEKDTKTPTEVYGEKIKELMLPDEVIENIYSTVFTFLCITNKRFIFFSNDIEFKEQKTTITTIPFSKVDSIEIEETTGKISLHNEIIIINRTGEYKLKVLKSEKDKLNEIYRTISNKIL